jgi:hypothetical protein
VERTVEANLRARRLTVTKPGQRTFVQNSTASPATAILPNAEISFAPSTTILHHATPVFA